MSKVSLYDTMINMLDNIYRDLKAANAADTVLLAIDDASVIISLSKETGEDRTMMAVRRLMAVGLMEEADGLFQMWLEA